MCGWLVIIRSRIDGLSRYDPATGYICSILLSQSYGQHNLIVLLINNLIYKEKDKDIILDSVGSF